MAYGQDRGPASSADPRHRVDQPAPPSVAAGNTGTIAVILAIVALFLAVLFFSGGPEQAVVPDATLPTSAPSTGAPAPETPNPTVTPSAPAAPETAPVETAPATPSDAAPVTPAPAN